MDPKIRILKLIQKQNRGYAIPSVTIISLERKPYLVLISCILSLRTKDKTTIEASRRLFAVAHTPKEMAKLSSKILQKLIYPVGFYRTKAKNIINISKSILGKFKGKVPDNLERLLEFKGVGRKTANLVLGLGYNIPAICVDTHVHRISNRLGWVKAHNPEDTEFALQKIIPKRYWIPLNTILVCFGQNLCLPISPYCSKCLVNKYCPKIGVIKRR